MVDKASRSVSVMIFGSCNLILFVSSTNYLQIVMFKDTRGITMWVKNVIFVICLFFFWGGGCQFDKTHSVIIKLIIRKCNLSNFDLPNEKNAELLVTIDAQIHKGMSSMTSSSQQHKSKNWAKLKSWTPQCIFLYPQEDVGSCHKHKSA